MRVFSTYRLPKRVARYSWLVSEWQRGWMSVNSRLMPSKLSGFHVHVAYLLGQPFRCEHLDLVAPAQQVAAKVDRGAHRQLEVGEILAVAYLALALVDGQVSQVIALIAVGPDDDALARGVVVDQHAIALVEILLAVEIGINLELDVGKRHVEDAVEGEDAEIVGLGLLGGSLAVEMAQDVPTLLEQLDAVGLEGEVVGHVGAVFPVLHGYPHTLLHGLDHRLQVFALVGHGLEQYARLQRQALADDVVHRQGGEHPVLHAVFMKHALVADEILITVLEVAVDVKAEDVFYGILVAVEGGAGHLLTAAHVGLYPFAVNVGERNLARLADGVQQPDVFLEFVGDFHDGWLYWWDGGVYLCANIQKVRATAK